MALGSKTEEVFLVDKSTSKPNRSYLVSRISPIHLHFNRSIQLATITDYYTFCHSSTHFTVNVSVSKPVPPAQIPARVDPPEITLSYFSGKVSENICLWITITENSLCTTQVPCDNWSYYAASVLRDTAMHWYYAKKMNNSGQTLPWDVS